MGKLRAAPNRSAQIIHHHPHCNLHPQLAIRRAALAMEGPRRIPSPPGPPVLLRAVESDGTVSAKTIPQKWGNKPGMFAANVANLPELLKRPQY
jgi:hypothetical protein